MTHPNQQEPLLYTSKGNIPMASLRYETDWQFDDQGITFTERYYDGEDVVKHNAHRYQLPEGATLKLTQGAING
jgi:hypothetical protein